MVWRAVVTDNRPTYADSSAKYYEYRSAKSEEQNQEEASYGPRRLPDELDSDFSWKFFYIWMRTIFTAAAAQRWRRVVIPQRSTEGASLTIRTRFVLFCFKDCSSKTRQRGPLDIQHFIWHHFKRTIAHYQPEFSYLLYLPWSTLSAFFYGLRLRAVSRLTGLLLE